MQIRVATVFYYFDTIVMGMSHVSASKNMTRQDFELHVIGTLEVFRPTIPDLLIKFEQDFPGTFQASVSEGQFDELLSSARQFLMALYDVRQIFSDYADRDTLSVDLTLCSRLADYEFYGKVYYITFYNDCDIDIIGRFGFRAELTSNGQLIEESLSTLTIPARTKREITFHHGELNRQIRVPHHYELCPAALGFRGDFCAYPSEAIEAEKRVLREGYDIELLKFTSAFDR